MSDLTRVIQRNPTVTLTRISLKQAPLGCTLTIRFLHNREHTLTGEPAGLAVVRTGAFADVEVGSTDPHLVGKVGSPLP